MVPVRTLTLDSWLSVLFNSSHVSSGSRFLDPRTLNGSPKDVTDSKLGREQFFFHPKFFSSVFVSHLTKKEPLFVAAGSLISLQDEDRFERRQQGHDRHREPRPGPRQVDRSVLHRHEGNCPEQLEPNKSLLDLLTLR